MNKITNPFDIINDFQDSIPVDLNGLARSLGVTVNYSFLGNEISGMIENKDNGNYLITVNAGDPPTRQRFTLAHELGHFIYHKDKMGTGIDDNRAYRSTDVGKYHNTLIGPKEETQANRFAANLLMPLDAINELKNQGITDCGDLAQRFGVSKHSMCLRIS